MASRVQSAFPPFFVFDATAVPDRPGKEQPMPRFTSDETWVIYQAIISGVASGPQSVCTQKEWEKMEREHPGARSIIRGGISNEGEAERLARGTSGDKKPRAGSPGAG